MFIARQNIFFTVKTTVYTLCRRAKIQCKQYIDANVNGDL